VAICAVADEALAIWSSEAPDENKKIALQLPQQDFYFIFKHSLLSTLVNKQKIVFVAIIRIGIVLIKTHFVALRTFDPPPLPSRSPPTGF